MKPSTFFSGIEQQELPFRQFLGRSPMFYRDAHLMGGIFTADLEQARALLPTPRHRALRVGCRAVVALHCLEYRHSDIGPYNEVSIAVGIAYGREPWFHGLRLLEAAARDRYHAYVAALPVTTEAALYGGLDIFGYPKYLAAITFAETDRERSCQLRDHASGELILEVRGAKIGTRLVNQAVARPELQTMTLTTYPQKGGEILRARLLVNLLERGQSFARTRMTLRIGSHQRGALLRRLDLGRQLQYLYAPRCEAILFYPERLEAAATDGHGSRR